LTGSGDPGVLPLGSRLAEVVGKMLFFVVLLGATVFPVVLGALGAYLAMAAALLLLPLLAGDRSARQAMRDERALWLLLASVLLLLVAFGFSARAPGDALLAVNFAPLLLAAPAYAAARRFATPQGPLVLALCIVGGLLLSMGAAITVYDPETLPRVHLPNDNPLHLAAMVTVAAGVGLCALFGPPGRWKMLALLGPPLAFVVVWYTGSRGAILGFLAVGAWALLMLWWTRPASRRRLAGLVAVGLVAVAILLIFADPNWRALTALQTLSEFVRTGTSTESAAFDRLMFYEAAWKGFLDSPVWGHGWARFYDVAVSNIPPERWTYGTDTFHHFHSDIADFAVAAGSLGLVAYALIIAAPVVGALASPRDSLRPARLYGAGALSLLYLTLGGTNLMLGWELQTTTYAMLTALLLGWCRPVPASG